MTGAQHYAKAEALLEEADIDVTTGNFEEADRLVRLASAHAALAQVAATIDATSTATWTAYPSNETFPGSWLTGLDDSARNTIAWREAIG